MRRQPDSIPMRLNRAGKLQHAVGKRRFTVIDMGDDGKVAYVLHVIACTYNALDGLTSSAEATMVTSETLLREIRPHSASVVSAYSLLPKT